MPEEIPAPCPARAPGKDGGAQREQGNSLLPALLPLGTHGSLPAQGSRRRAKNRRSVLQEVSCAGGARPALINGQPLRANTAAKGRARSPRGSGCGQGVAAGLRAEPWRGSGPPGRHAEPLAPGLVVCRRRGEAAGTPSSPLALLPRHGLRSGASLVERGPWPPLRPSGRNYTPGYVTCPHASLGRRGAHRKRRFRFRFESEGGGHGPVRIHHARLPARRRSAPRRDRSTATFDGKRPRETETPANGGRRSGEEDQWRPAGRERARRPIRGGGRGARPTGRPMGAARPLGRRTEPMTDGGGASAARPMGRGGGGRRVYKGGGAGSRTPVPARPVSAPPWPWCGCARS